MESRGHSSCRGQEDGDGSERPLKKARFAWQVKGKHHSKNETNPVIPSPSREIQGSTSAATVEEHLITKTNSCDSRNNDYENNVSNGTIMAQENLYNHNSISSRSQNDLYGRTLDIRDNHGLDPFQIFQHLSGIENKSFEDQYLLQWQTHQMIACCTDNIINRITDRRMQAPSTTGSSLRALNMAQFLNHLPGNNTIENEGILMAISAHGLQNNISVTHREVDSDDDDETDEIPSDSIATSETQLPNQEPDVIEDNENDVGFFDDVQSLEDDNHFLFMNAAVQFAISSKGLTASGT